MSYELCIICHTPEKLMVDKRKELLYPQRPLLVKQLPLLLHWLVNTHILDYSYVYVRQLCKESHSCVHTMGGGGGRRGAVPSRRHLLRGAVTRGGALWPHHPYWSTCSVKQPISVSSSRSRCVWKQAAQGSNINIHLWCHDQMFWVNGDTRRRSSSSSFPSLSP